MTIQEKCDIFANLPWLICKNIVYPTLNIGIIHVYWNSRGHQNCLFVCWTICHYCYQARNYPTHCNLRSTILLIQMIKVIGFTVPPFANSCGFHGSSNRSGSQISNCQFPGLKLEYLNIIQEAGILHFQLIHQPVVGHGILDKNLTWTRDFGKIISGSLDTAVPYIVATSDRSQSFDFR